MNYVLSSPAARVFFEGFESTTHALHSAGWQMAFERDLERDGVRIALKNPSIRMYGLSDYTRGVPRCVTADYRGNIGDEVGPFVIRGIHSDIKIMREFTQGGHSLRPDAYSGFKTMDPVPAILTMDEWYLSGADIFRTFKDLAPEKKIFLAEASEHDLLKTIIEKQQPMQAEIRERMRLAQARGEPPKENIQAQIIQLANFR